MEKLHIRKDSRVIHCFYKTTNLINDNFYYGIHSTKNLKDNYLGSGILIELAIKKHGRNNFKREILKKFKTRDEARDYERQIVNEQLLKNRKCYNRALGGQGGYLGPEAIEKMRLSKLGSIPWNKGTAASLPVCLDCGNHTVGSQARRCKICSLKSNLNPACKGRTYITPTGVYATKSDAAKNNNLTIQTFSRRLQSDPDNFKVQK